MQRFNRSEMLIGRAKQEKLKNCRVAVFGIGGVGGCIAEALARAGVGHITLIDNDTVDITNINRQIIALNSTIGKTKTEAMKMRILDINPSCAVETFNTFYMPENAKDFDLTKYDYIADAVDTVSAKIELAVGAENAGVPIISAMGTGNKLDPTRFEVDDIYKTSECPLARVMRYELKKRGVKHLKVVYSKETPIKPQGEKTPSSISFVPPVAGFIMAGEIIRGLIDV